MKYLLRPYRTTGKWMPAVAVALLSAAFAGHAAAQSAGIAQVMDQPSPLLHTSSATQGYLGVLVGDLDSESVPKLKLKDTHGAVITLIDHDAPAAQAGLRVTDVVLQVNGQAVENAEQFGRTMREIPAGRSVALVISRDGATQTVTIQLVDRKKMEHDVWNRLDSSAEPPNSGGGLGILSGGGDVPSGTGFHMPFVGTNTLSVGAMVEPLTSQMADYLGIHGGLMIKQVARKSEAEKAGLKAYDVVLRVGADTVATTADWDRALRANQDKAVAVLILRDRRQQALNLQVDSKHHR
jgi:S1-C subfamily serine protease